jgi:DNA primase
MFTVDNISLVYTEQTKFLDKIAKFYRHNLLVYHGAMAYLVEERKISMEMLAKFQIGYAANSSALLDFIVLNNLKEELLYTTGIFKIMQDEVYDHFYDRIMFPIFDISSNIIGFSGRIWRKDSVSTSKFVNSPDTPVYRKTYNLYGLNFAIESIYKTGFAWVVEGIPDVIACHSAGITNTVSAGGTSVTLEQLLIIRYFTKNIAFCFDNDTAGKKAISVIQPMLKSLKFNFISVFLSPSKDPDEALRDFGPSYLQTFLKNPF